MVMKLFLKFSVLNTGLCWCFKHRFFSTPRPFSESYFSADERKKCIERLQKMKAKPGHVSTKLKNAAVLIPLCNTNGEISLLYTLRKHNLKRHRGQVSFPGGIQDSKDSDLEATALRETEEELGIHRNSIEVWGCGSAMFGREFNIYPVVGFINGVDLEQLKPNPGEVELAFTTPLKHFYDSQNCRYTHYRNGMGNYILPVYLNSKCKIWGITALVTHMFLKALSPHIYKHELHLVRPYKMDP